MCSPSYGCRGTPVVARMCVYTARKNYYINYNKGTGTRTKNLFTKKEGSRNEAAKNDTDKRNRDTS